MTPEKAKALLSDVTPGPWKTLVDKHTLNAYVHSPLSSRRVADYMTGPDAALTATAPELAKQIAGMSYEYDYDVQFGEDWSPQGYAFESLEVAQRHVAERKRRTPARIVRRLVGDWEVIE